MFRRGEFRLKAIILGLLLALGASLASAYEVSPMIYDLEPSGTRATQLIRVHNDSDRPITIEVVAERREFDPQGNESRTPADDDFILFPPQAVVPAGATQAVRVQYIGAQNLEHSVMYNVTVKQVPVALPATGPSGVQFVFNFSTVANVVPRGAHANVEVASVTRNGAVISLRLRNSGNKYANLAASHVTLSGGGQEALVDGDNWRRAIGTSWLLPGHERIINIPAAAAASVTGDAIQARFSLVETRVVG